jgi:hypothetical protein
VVAVRICCPHATLFVSGQNIDDARPLLALMELDGIVGQVDAAKEQLTALWRAKTAGVQGSA